MAYPSLSIVILGATGAVGQATLAALLASRHELHVTTLGRRKVDCPDNPRLTQHLVDIHDPSSYAHHLTGQQAAICTLGVGQPSAMSQADFIRIDKDAVLGFARACKTAGVAHFQLLGSVGADARSRSFYLRTKGELQQALTDLSFARLSLFNPSMILTPTNRYGFSQAVTLAIWPHLDFLLRGSARKLRGIPVAQLGQAMAANIFSTGNGAETLYWPDFKRLAGTGDATRAD